MADKRKGKKKPARDRRSGRPTGRPTLFTREVRAKICAALYRGHTRRAAAEAAGIALRTFEDWMVEGRKESRGEFARFARQVHMAEAGAEKQVVDALFEAAISGDRQAAIEWLKRRRREDWGDRVSIDLARAAEQVAAAAGVPVSEIQAMADQIAAEAWGE